MAAREQAQEHARKQEYFHARTPSGNYKDTYYATDKGGTHDGVVINLSGTDWQWSTHNVFAAKEEFASTWEPYTFDELPKNVQNAVLRMYGITSEDK